MIRVTMDLDALGMGLRVSRLCDVEIINDGTGTLKRGNYRVVVKSKAGRVMREGRVENWPRKAKHPVDLLAAALESVRK